MSKRAETDWMEQIEDEEFIVLDGKKTVPLKVLSRLGDKADLVSMSCVASHAVSDRGVVFYNTATVKFDDGTEWCGTADCHTGNCKPPFINYPTATAESRALARALKRGLGLHDILATEEIDAGVGQAAFNTKGKADSQVVKAIMRNMEAVGVDGMAVIEAVCTEDRAAVVCALDDLTITEAKAALKYLDELKSKAGKKQPKASTKEARDARKKELESKVGG